MKTILNVLFLVVIVTAVGCQEEQDSRINMREGIRSDNLVDNYVTRPIAGAFSVLAGEGIDIKQAIARRNNAGLLELQIRGYNRSVSTKRFRYRVEWLDENGFSIQNKTSTWLRASVASRSPFDLKIVAPRPEAVNFRMDTKKWE